MRIDSSGNLLVGKTSSDNGATAGFEAQQDGDVAIAKSGRPLIVNRLSSDGAIADFRKDGAPVGSIGVSGGNNTYFSATATNHGGIMFSDAGSSQPTINPCSSGSTLADGSLNIGGSTYRFKDLYLSGGVYLGGTGSANKLDDYEEGTWLPGVEFTSAGSTATTANSQYTTGSYTKIGNVVTVEFNISGIVFGNGTGNVKITGLPFTHVGIAAYSGKLTASSGYLISAHTASGYGKSLKLYGVTNPIFQYANESGTSWQNITNSNASTVSPNSINGQFTYHTNQ
jgi:hypothetical protein